MLQYQFTFKKRQNAVDKIEQMYYYLCINSTGASCEAVTYSHRKSAMGFSCSHYCPCYCQAPEQWRETRCRKKWTKKRRRPFLCLRMVRFGALLCTQNPACSFLFKRAKNQKITGFHRMFFLSLLYGPDLRV